jgi:hypothetical protein
VSYSIFIKRDAPISIEEWSAVVAARPDVRLSDAPVTAVNPQTGAQISIGRGPGDADVLVDSAWLPCFHFQPRGSISFRAPDDFNEPESVVTSTAWALARALNARLVGEEGEEY